MACGISWTKDEPMPPALTVGFFTIEPLDRGMNIFTKLVGGVPQRRATVHRRMGEENLPACPQHACRKVSFRKEYTHTEFEDLETDTIKTIQALESLPILQVRLQIIRESTMIKTVQRRILSR